MANEAVNIVMMLERFKIFKRFIYNLRNNTLYDGIKNEWGNYLSALEDTLLSTTPLTIEGREGR